MSIRNKLLLFFVIQHLFFLVMAIGMYQFILRPHNLETEKNYAKDKIVQIRNVFDSEIRHLRLLSTDWAVWDDTYSFVQGKNQAYIESNFPPDLLEDLKLSRIEIFDRHGKSVFFRTDTDLDMSPLMKDAHTLKKEFNLSEPGNKNENRAGVVSFGKSIALVSISSILRGDRRGPSGGMMVMVRLIDEDMIEQINKSTQVELSLLNIRDLPSDSKVIDKDFAVEVVDDERLFSLGYLQGLDDNVSIVMKASLKREFAIQSRELVVSLFIFASILGVISLIASLYLMRKSVSQPLSDLVEHISKIRNDENYTKYELDKRDDEIGLMAAEFNLLLDKLNRTNEALLKAARIDIVTGLPNRMDMEEKLQRVKDISIREGVEFTILMVDIDYFKNYNDTYGHVKGDEALRRVGQALKESSVRPGDYFARYGGEEFIALLENTDSKGAVTVMKRILKNIEELHIEHKSSLLEKKRMSVSIGCLTIVAKKGDTQEYIVNIADEALYRAKESGRDRYYVYENRSRP